MLTTKSIKTTAKTQLYQNWSKAYAAMAFILMASLSLSLAEHLVNSLLSSYGIIKGSAAIDESISGLSSLSSAIVETVTSQNFIYNAIISVFFLLISFLVVSPLRQGSVRWYYSVARGSKTYLSRMFYFYQSNNAYISHLMFKIAQLFRSIFYGIVSFLAAFASLSLTVYQFSVYSRTELASDRQKAVLYLMVSLVMLFLGVILYILLMLKYFLAEYLFISSNHHNVSFKAVNQCFTKSKEIMSGNSGKVISLAISFIPALLLCILIVPIFYVYPYINCSFAVLASEIINESKASDKKD